MKDKTMINKIPSQKVITLVLVSMVLLYSILGLSAAPGVVLANPLADYGLSWWTVDGGGGTSQSADGKYTLDGTVGQQDVGVATNGNYSVRGGFWDHIAAILKEFFVYLPIVLK